MRLWPYSFLSRNFFALQPTLSTSFTRGLSFFISTQMTTSPIDITSSILSSALNMQACSVHIDRSEGKILLEHQESVVQPGHRRDDIQLQRLGKKPVLKAF